MPKYFAQEILEAINSQLELLQRTLAAQEGTVNTGLIRSVKPNQALNEANTQLKEVLSSKDSLNRQMDALVTALERLTLGVIVFDESGRVLLFNQATEILLGLPSADLTIDQWPAHLGLYASEADEAPMPFDALPFYAALAQAQQADAEIFVRSQARPDGLWVKLAACPVVSGAALSGAICIVTDLTSTQAELRLQFQLEQALEAQAQPVVQTVQSSRADEILQKSPEAFIAIDINGCVTDFNEAAELSLGFKGAELIGRNVSEFAVPFAYRALFDPVVGQLFEKGRAGLPLGYAELPVLGADGRERKVKLSVFYLSQAGHEMLGGFFEDVTDKTIVEQRKHARHEATRMVADATSFQDLVSRLVHSITANIDWEVGVLWLVDPSTKTLSCAHFWHQNSALDEFIQGNQDVSIKKGEGFLGKIWERLDCDWTTDLTAAADDKQAKLAEAAGLHTSVAFPVKCNGELEAIFQFCVADLRERDEDLIAILRDIGAQASRFADLHRTIGVRQKMAAIVESTDDAVLSLSLSGVITSWNGGAQRMYGWDPNLVIGQNIGVLYGGADREAEVKELITEMRTSRTAKHCRTNHVTRQGKALEVALTLSPIVDTAGRVVSIGLTARDVTEATAHEQELEQQNKDLQEQVNKLAESGNDAAADQSASEIAALKQRGQELESLKENLEEQVRTLNAANAAAVAGDNAAALSEFKQRAEQLETLNKDLQEQVRKLSEAGAQTGSASDSPASAEIAALKRKEQELETRNSELLEQIRKLTEAGMQAPSAQAPADVAEFKRREEELETHNKELQEQVRRLREVNATAAIDKIGAPIQGEVTGKDPGLGARFKSEFLTKMNREVRTPMNAILGLSEVFGRSSTLTPEEREYFNIIQESGATLLNAFNDIIEYSKIEDGYFAPEINDFSLRDTLESVGDYFAGPASAKRLSITTFVSPAIAPMLSGDSKKLKKILIKLLETTLKHLDRGGLLIRAVPERTMGDQHYVRIVLSDIGSGLSTITKAPVPNTGGAISSGESFDSTKLGLSLTKHFVEEMGGTIGLEGTNADGTASFWIVIPFQAAVAVEPQPTQTPFVGRRVLVADGPAGAARIIQAYSESWGLTCDARLTADEVLASMKRQASMSAAYDLVVIENVAFGMSGHALIKLIQDSQDLSSTDILFYDPFLDQEQTKALSTTGVKAVLHGALKESALRAAIVELLKSRPSLRAETAPSGLVLIADDNLINRKVASLQLSSLGISAHSVADGRQVVEAATKNQYALILMDVEMPELDGYAATRAIRSMETPQGRRTPIVAVTANASEVAREQCISAGMDDFISHPVQIDRLSQVLKKWIPAELLGSLKESVKPQSRPETKATEAAAPPPVAAPAHDPFSTGFFAPQGLPDKPSVPAAAPPPPAQPVESLSSVASEPKVASEPAADVASEPAVMAVSEPAVMAVSEPAAMVASEPAADVASDPAVMAASEPAAMAASEPAAMVASEPAAIAPAVVPSQSLAEQPEVKPATGLPPLTMPVKPVEPQAAMPLVAPPPPPVPVAPAVAAVATPPVIMAQVPVTPAVPSSELDAISVELANTPLGELAKITQAPSETSSLELSALSDELAGITPLGASETVEPVQSKPNTPAAKLEAFSMSGISDDDFDFGFEESEAQPVEPMPTQTPQPQPITSALVPPAPQAPTPPAPPQAPAEAAPTPAMGLNSIPGAEELMKLGLDELQEMAEKMMRGEKTTSPVQPAALDDLDGMLPPNLPTPAPPAATDLTPPITLASPQDLAPSMPLPPSAADLFSLPSIPSTPTTDIPAAATPQASAGDESGGAFGKKFSLFDEPGAEEFEFSDDSEFADDSEFTAALPSEVEANGHETNFESVPHLEPIQEEVPVPAMKGMDPSAELAALFDSVALEEIGSVDESAAAEPEAATASQKHVPGLPSLAHMFDDDDDFELSAAAPDPDVPAPAETAEQFEAELKALRSTMLPEGQPPTIPPMSIEEAAVEAATRNESGGQSENAQPLPPASTISGLHKALEAAAIDQAESTKPSQEAFEEYLERSRSKQTDTAALLQQISAQLEANPEYEEHEEVAAAAPNVVPDLPPSRSIPSVFDGIEIGGKTIHAEPAPSPAPAPPQAPNMVPGVGARPAQAAGSVSPPRSIPAALPPVPTLPAQAQPPAAPLAAPRPVPAPPQPMAPAASAIPGIPTMPTPPNGDGAGLPPPAVAQPAAAAPVPAAVKQAENCEIDLQRLERICGSSGMREIISEFVESSERMISGLDTAVQRRDEKEQKKIAHEFSGSCSAMGAAKLQELALSMQLLRPDDWDSRAVIMKELKERYSSLKIALAPYLAVSAGTQD